jgi:hypothetical protein
VADAIVIDRKDVDVFHSSNTLAIALGPAYDSGFVAGKSLYIAILPTRTIVARVLGARREPWGRHNWLVDVECDEMEALREALTYEVAGRAPEPPKFERGDPCTS